MGYSIELDIQVEELERYDVVENWTADDGENKAIRVGIQRTVIGFLQLTF